MHDLSKICDALAEKGYIVWPQFLSTQEVSEVRDDIAKLHEQNLFKLASIGKGTELSSNDSIRSDSTFWLNGSDEIPAREKLLSLTEQLRTTLNRELYLNLTEFEGHYAHYRAGSFYARHSDVHKRSDARVVSLVLYLNDANWKETDGGQLRIYLERDQLDVRPEGGTLVLFMSSRFEHEVMPANRDRYSFTGWFRRRNSVS